jgi:hypothetical protein
MNDYFAGNLARERQADYLREIAHDELVAQVHRAAEAVAPATDRDSVAHPAHLRLRALLGRLLIAVTASLMLTLALIGPVAAAGGSGGCAVFGAATVEGAHAGGFGSFVAGYASGGPGVLSGIVAGEHAEMCVAR